MEVEEAVSEAQEVVLTVKRLLPMMKPMLMPMQALVAAVLESEAVKTAESVVEAAVALQKHFRALKETMEVLIPTHFLSE